MKTLIYAGKEVKLRGMVRNLKQMRFDRAVLNSFHQKFNEKFKHPRHLRQWPSMKP